MPGGVLRTLNPAKTDGTKLHSRYNPQAEAARYVDSLNLKDNIKCFILIEPGLGYIIPVLKERFKSSRIIVLHIDNFSVSDEGIPVLYSTETAEVQGFLEKNIPDTDINDIRIIEWRPSVNFFKDKYLKILSQVAGFLKQTDAVNRTTKTFGRRWVRNFFNNLENTCKILLYRKASLPVIITGSGPSLEQTLPLIKKYENQFLIIAASSSVTALSHNGIKADLIITTDGGCWSLHHIYPCIRNKQILETPLALNLCAALPSQCCVSSKLIINDGSFWQNIILHELSIPSVIIPQRGTVTATAAELAMILSSGSIYLTGMDFSVMDIRTHVRPYGFDSLFFGNANRFHPVYTELYTRSAQIKQGGSLDIYAAWFKNQLTSWPKRIFNIGLNHKIFENTDILFNDDKVLMNKNKLNNKSKNIEKEDFFKIIEKNEDPEFFRKRGTQALIKALNDPEYKENLRKELGSLLFPDDNEFSQKDLETAIINISMKTNEISDI